MRDLVVVTFPVALRAALIVVFFCGHASYSQPLDGANRNFLFSCQSALCSNQLWRAS